MRKLEDVLKAAERKDTGFEEGVKRFRKQVRGSRTMPRNKKDDGIKREQLCLDRYVTPF